MSAKSIMTVAGVVALFAITQVASAHPGHVGPHGGFGAGAAHPISGLDHLLAMLAVGLCAAQIGGRAFWMLPVTFLASMLVGELVAVGGGGVPMVEQGIAASVLVMGLMLATGSRVSLPAVMALIGLFAIFHGYAHGAEMQPGTGYASYAMGFIGTTAMLHAIGIAMGQLFKRTAGIALPRLAGASIAACGFALLMGL